MKDTTIRVVSDPKEFESLAEIWNSLLQKCPHENSIYLTHEWLLAWWKHFGDDKRLNILLVEKAQQVVAIVPLMKVQYRAVLIKLHVLETIGSVNCNYVGLFLPENRQEAIATLFDYLGEELKKSKLILRLPLVPDDCQFVKQLRKHAVQFWNGLVMQEGARTLAPYISLTATWEEYFHSLNPKRRRHLRWARKSLEKSHIVEFREYTAGPLRKGLSEFFDLHQRRWRSVNIRSPFSDPEMREFYKDIADTFFKKKWLHFTFLCVDNKIVSAIYGFIYNGKFYATTAARDISYSKYSVGHLHYAYLIKEAISKNLREFDFLRGDEPYKFNWTKSARIYTQVIVIKNGFGSGLSLRFLHAFFRYYGLMRYSLREVYTLYLIRRREKKRSGKWGWERFTSYSCLFNSLRL